jgi:VWFA-related protein
VNARVLGLAVAASVTLAAEAHQSQQRQEPPRFGAAVNLIEVDVSVLDRARQPVRGLTPADFTILENNIPQKIAVLSEIFVPDPAPPTATWMRTATPDVRVNTGAGSRLFVIVLDDAMIPSNPRTVAGVKEASRRFVDRLGPTDLAAIVFTMDGRQAQEFTSDRARLLAAIERFAPGFGGGELFEKYSLSTVRRVAEYLAGVPQRRKALIYVSTGVPVDFGALGPAQPGVFGDPGGRHGALKQELQDIFKEAQRANVNIYPIDPQGLAGFDVDPGGPNLARDSLLALAENTGGFALVNNNEFASGVTQIFRENGSYYLLGYQSTDPRTDGKFRRLEVRVRQPGLTVRARSGHMAERAGQKERDAQASPLTKAISGLVPVTDMAIRATAAPFAIAGRSEAAVIIVLGLRHPAAETRVRERVDLVVRAYDSDRRERGVQAFRTDLTLRPAAESEKEGKFEVQARMELKPGRYQLRLGVHSAALGKSGSLYHDIDVPDFAKEPVSLSGIVLHATPPVTSASMAKDKLAAFLPVSPTTQREFTKHQATAFLRVYQGGRSAPAPVTLNVSVVDGRDVRVFGASETLGADRFGPARAADYRFELPLERLKPGSYLLAVDVTRGSAAARREVPFIVYQ